MAIRRHWIIYIFLGINFLIAVFITALVLVFLSWFIWAYMALLIFWQLVAIFIYIKWLDHELDLFVITNNRIIGIEQLGFLNRSLGECNLWQVQDMRSQTAGLLSNILDYGTLTIQTAWSANNFEMDFAPKVIQTARKVLNVVDDYRDNESWTNWIL